MLLIILYSVGFLNTCKKHWELLFIGHPWVVRLPGNWSEVYLDESPWQSIIHVSTEMKGARGMGLGSSWIIESSGSFASCVLFFPIAKCGSHFGIFDHLTFSSLMYYTCFCEFVIFPAPKPVQYIEIYKRSLTASEFNFSLKLLNERYEFSQAFPTIFKVKCLLAGSKLTQGQNQIWTKFILACFNPFVQHPLSLSFSLPLIEVSGHFDAPILAFYLICCLWAVWVFLSHNFLLGISDYEE